MFARELESRRFLGPVALATALVGALLACRVVSYDVKMTGLSVSPGSATIPPVASQQFTATATYSDDSTHDVTAEATWTSSDPTVASVSGGLVTPSKAGITTITASFGGHSASSTLTVALLVSLDVTPTNPSIQNGTRIQFTATGHFDDQSASDLTAQVTWTSSDSSVTIGDTAGSKGLAESTALGYTTSTITAALGAISNSTTLTVRSATLSSVTVTPATATIKAGRAQQFTATGTFSDLSTHDMTREVGWQSSDTGIATIEASGLATGKFASATAVTITATSTPLLGSVQGTAQLTVQAAGPGY